MSWTSYWRIPRVRCIASRPIAKTSGSDVVEGGLDPLVLLLPAVLRQLAAALEVGVVELVVGRLVGLGDLADLLADLGEARADLVVARAPAISASSALASSTIGWMRRSSRSLESTKREKNRMAGEV